MKSNRRRAEKTEPKKSRAAVSDSPADERGLKIGEAAKVIGVEAYVLRFWETQFQILKPKHARSKHRFYQPRDIETLRRRALAEMRRDLESIHKMLANH
jgi:DNA-binding transcriptional MerR regulator